MFARFRNLFSKNKIESEAETASVTDFDDDGKVSANEIVEHAATTKLEGLSFLKSLVESEKQKSVENNANNADSLSKEVAELLKKQISKNEQMSQANTEQISKDPITNGTKFLLVDKNHIYYEQDETQQACLAINLAADSENVDSVNIPYVGYGIKDKQFKVSLGIEEYPKCIKTGTENSSETDFKDEAIVFDLSENKNINDTNLDLLSDKNPISVSNNETTIGNSAAILKISKSLSQAAAHDNNANSTIKSVDHPLASNPCNNSSIVVEDLPSEITTPSPTVESTISGSSSNTSSLESRSISEVLDSSKIIINPINNNGLACNAITNKLSNIAEVAESLDAVIRDVQENAQLDEIESSARPSHKKLGTLRSTSSEDWHSRSTEDDSFATASEGNFTPSSASFHTASGRTSSFISCDKNSYDASEADDSTYAYEMPDLSSPLNMSFEESEQSYLSTQPLNNLTVQNEQNVPTRMSYTTNTLAGDQDNSTADISDLHSENITPIPEQHYDGDHIESIPIVAETELEVVAIADAPPMEILTEHATMPMSRTPEVSSLNENISSNQSTITTEITVNLIRDSNDQQQQQQQNNSNTNNSNNNNNIKPNAAWRRSKYYENITKQTIKGFL